MGTGVTCPIEGCTLDGQALPMCPTHWFMVPGYLRNGVKRASARSGERSEAYRQALAAAVAVVERRRPE